MKLLEICPSEKWQALEDQIQSLSGLSVSVFNTDGIRLNPTERWPNRLCPQIKDDPKGQSFICATAHMNIANQAKQSREAVIEECDAGLVKLAVPIFVEDIFLGTVCGCGLVLEDGEVDVYAVHKIVGMDEEAVQSLSEGIGSISIQKIRQLVALIEKQVKEIVSDYHAIKET